jgi:hypothetical protein
MTFLLIILVNVGMGALIIFGLVIAYNLGLTVVYFLKYKFINYNAEYFSRRISEHGKLTLMFSAMFIITVLGIYLYYLPVSFDKVAIGIENVDIIYAQHTTQQSSHIRINDKDKVKDILNTLNRYKFKRNMSQSNIGHSYKSGTGTEVVTLWLHSSTDRKLVTLNISNAGFITDGGTTGQAYTVVDENEKVFFDEVYKIIAVEKGELSYD